MYIYPSAFINKLTAMKLLIIEDNIELSEMIETAFKLQRFIVELASNYSEALSKIHLYEYDCILLDIMLPDGSGLSILKQLKEMNKSEGVIIISARDSLDDKIEGLELGADDYVSKPFHMSELIARVRSVLRRNNNNGHLTIDLGNVSIEPDKFRVCVKGKEIDLLKKEYDILHYMMERPNILIKKSMLAEAIWGDYIDQVDNYDFIYTQLKNLRSKLTKAESTTTIKTVYGFGYKICEEE